MIKIINKAFVVGDDVFVSIEDAQKQEIRNIFMSQPEPDFDSLSPKIDAGSFIISAKVISYIADVIVNNKNRVLDVLTTVPKSRPNRRKIHKSPVAQKAGAEIS